MIPPHEVVLELDNVILVLVVGPVHHLEQLVLDLGLVQEGLLVLDDLQREYQPSELQYVRIQVASEK